MINMLAKNIIFILALFSSVLFAGNLNLYSEASTDSKVIAKIDSKNETQFIKFYTDKNGKWAKYANSNTGQVGWLNLADLNQEKTDQLRHELLSNIDKKISALNNKISHLTRNRVKINTASYEELQNYKNNLQGHHDYMKIPTSWYSWLGSDGLIHSNSDQNY